MNKTTLLILLIGSILFNPALAQNRAPSCWLKYNDSFKGDILVNTVSVSAPSPLYTYYCTMQWNAGTEAGGYCGIQEHPDGRNFIFSIWDPVASNEPIRAAYLGEGTMAENFGGEGTGLKSWNFSLGWETGQWYTFVTRAWDFHSHTHFGYWVYDPVADLWHHLVTMDFPVEGVRFSTATGSFIEDWLGNGWNAREVHHQNGWKRASTGRYWRAFENAYFERVKPDTGAANYIDHYDGGVSEEGYYFMSSGGNTEPEHEESGSTLHLNQTLAKPVFDKLKIASLTVSNMENNQLISWELDPHSVPQFSFTIDLLGRDTEQTVFSSVTAPVPQQRSATLDVQDVERGDYVLRLVIEDIFGLSADTVFQDITLGTTGTVLIHEPTINIWVEDDFLRIEGQQESVDDHWNYKISGINGQALSQGTFSDRIKIPEHQKILIIQLISPDSNHQIIKKLYMK